MVGICSSAESFTGEEAAASGIGRRFRSGRGLGRRGWHRLYCGFGICGSGGILGGFQFFGRWRIEDAIGQRSKRLLKGRQDLLPGAATAIEGIELGLDLGAELIGSAPELVQETRDLAPDLGHFLGTEKDQRQEKQEDHLAREAKIHAPIIMRDGDTGHWRVEADKNFTKRKRVVSPPRP